MAHGFSAVREQRLDAYAERFQAAGLGVLLFDYRHFGASPGEPRQLLDIKRQREDYRAAIAHARSLDGVDPERIALFGSSFSGGHVLSVGATDPGIAAIVAQCPFTDGLASLPKLGARNIALATVAGLRDRVRALTGRAPYYMPAVGPPGTLAVMSTPDAQPGFAGITPPGSTWENRVAARIALAVGLDRPGRAAARLTRSDPVLRVRAGHRRAGRGHAQARGAAPQAEIRRYACGHFEIYVGEPFDRAVADQTEFLTRTLGVLEAGESGVPVSRSDPYAVLGIGPNVTDAELRAAYRSAVQRHHPDHNGGSAESARRFEEVQEAYAAIRTQRASGAPGARRAAPREPGARADTDSLDDRLASRRAAGGDGGRTRGRPGRPGARPPSRARSVRDVRDGGARCRPRRGAAGRHGGRATRSSATSPPTTA